MFSYHLHTLDYHLNAYFMIIIIIILPLVTIVNNHHAGIYVFLKNKGVKEVIAEYVVLVLMPRLKWGSTKSIC